jgi:hypothetical protein
MATDVYKQFDKATEGLAAYALTDKASAEAVGRIVIKHGGRTVAFVQVWGAEMKRSAASGYGYDKASEAVCIAAAALEAGEDKDADTRGHVARIRAAMRARDDGERWENRLNKAGYVVQHIL